MKSGRCLSIIFMSFLVLTTEISFSNEPDNSCERFLLEGARLGFNSGSKDLANIFVSANSSNLDQAIFEYVYEQELRGLGRGSDERHYSDFSYAEQLKMVAILDDEKAIDGALFFLIRFKDHEGLFDRVVTYRDGEVLSAIDHDSTKSLDDYVNDYETNYSETYTPEVSHLSSYITELHFKRPFLSKMQDVWGINISSPNWLTYETLGKSDFRNILFERSLSIEIDLFRKKNIFGHIGVKLSRDKWEPGVKGWLNLKSNEIIFGDKSTKLKIVIKLRAPISLDIGGANAAAIESIMLYRKASILGWELVDTMRSSDFISYRKINLREAPPQ